MRPLNRCYLNSETVSLESLHLFGKQYRTKYQWLTRLQNSFHKSLLQDRHYMSKIEENVCIAALDQGNYKFQSIDGLRIILAHRFNNILNVRELPVSLLRLYFSGQQHFKDMMNHLSLSAYRQLLEYANQDQYEKQHFPEYIQFILDATFCSFERTLVMMANYKYQWPDFGLKSGLHSDSYWTNMSLPVKDVNELGNRDQYLIYYAMLWRINVTLQIEKFLKPWEINPIYAVEQKEWLLYRLKLFRDTHLDLSTLMIHRHIYDNQSVAPFIGLYWPTSDRVCCLEELPDLSQYSLDNLKSGTNLKERSALKDKYSHIFFNKSMNNICGNRNYYEIYERYSEQDETISDVMKLNSRCMLLGNAPKSKGHLSWISRVRINFTFWPSYCNVIITTDEIHRVVPKPRNPFLVHEKKVITKLAKAREKGIPDEQIINDSKKIQNSKLAKMTRFSIWILRCSYFVASLMREYLCSVLEEGLCVDEFFGLDYKWNAYKEIVRIGNAHCRNEISLQCSQLSLDQTMDWFVIEYVEKLDGNNYANKRGKIMEFHDLILDVTTKAPKRDFKGIIKIKGTATEKKLPIGSEPIELIYDYESNENRTKPTLEELDFIAWYMAQNEDAILETRWFQVLGMSEVGIEKLRDWYFKYRYYEPADDSYKKKIESLQAHRHLDYFILITVINLIIYHEKMSDIFFMPLCMARNTTHAVRTNLLHLPSHQESPALMTTSYRCHGCQKFACSVVPPLNYRMQANYCELVRCHNKIYYNGQLNRPGLDGVTVHHLSLIIQNQVRHIEPYRTELSRISQNRNTISLRKSKKKGNDVRLLRGTTTGGGGGGGGKKQKQETEEEKRLRLIREEEEKRRKENISFLTVAFYDIHDGKPYCIRNKRKAIAATKVDQDEEFRPVMISRRNHTIIEVNRPLSEMEIIENKKNEDYDSISMSTSDQDSDNDVIPDVYVPEYESNRLLMDPNISDLHSLCDVLNRGKDQSTVRNNDKSESAIKKKRISEHILSPLKQLYSCRKPLQAIDTASVIVGTEVRCSTCGVMTQMNSYNMTSRGVSCMRHIDRTFTRNHPIWDIDTHNVNAMNQMIHNEQKDYKQKKLHYKDVLGSHYISLNQCDFCGLQGGKQLITTFNTEFKLHKRMACKECYRYNRNNLLKNYIIPDPLNVRKF